MEISKIAGLLKLDGKEQNVLRAGKVFDAREDGDVKNSLSTKLVSPWTYLISDGTGRFVVPCIGNPENGTCGFTTKEEAQARADAFDEHVAMKSNNGAAYLVLKNADFTEGRGPMVPVKIFSSPSKAHGWIMSQEGIQGTVPWFQLNYGVNIQGDLYCITSYNGYKIRLMDVEGMVLPESQRRVIISALNYILHVGSGKTSRGEPHPQALLVSQLEDILCQAR